MDVINKTEQMVKQNLDKILQNPYVMAVLKIVLVLYASSLAPRLPTVVQTTFANTFVKIIAVALIAYLAEVDFQLAIILAVIFVLGINASSGRGIFESYTNPDAQYFTDQTKYTNLLGQPAVVGNAVLLDSSSDNYSSCNNVKMADLLSVFDNDKLKLQDTVMYAYHSLIQQLPQGSTAQANLESIAKAIGIPGNMEFTDENASTIATILLNAGFAINDKCRPPFGDNMIN